MNFTLLSSLLFTFDNVRVFIVGLWAAVHVRQAMRSPADRVQQLEGVQRSHI